MSTDLTIPGLDFLEDVVRLRYNVMGCNTYRVKGIFGEMISTADPENIQAILATKFTDFDRLSPFLTSLLLSWKQSMLT